MQPVFVTEYLSKFRLEFLVKILFHKSVILFKCYQEGEVNEESLLGSYRVEMAKFEQTLSSGEHVVTSQP